VEFRENTDMHLLELGDHWLSIDQILVDLLTAIQNIAELGIRWHFDFCDTQLGEKKKLNF
jgi:hypothetical protein